ncbi:putative transmembrane protein [Flavobacterium daejeonense]|nr:putative transmembrane protein [Flavobacterium daejeonense]
MPKKLFPFFSYLFHPVFIPIYATLFYLFSNQSYFFNKEKYLVLLEVSVITFAIPILFFVLLRLTGKITSIMVPELSERKFPLVIQCFLLILLVKKSITLERYPELHFFMLGALSSTLIALILLFANKKASLHMTGLSALTFFIFGLSLHHHTANTALIIFMVLMNGFVASSRLIMKAHTPQELVIGVLLGSIPQILLLFLWL